KYWPADVQVIGKDNLRFHAAIWPGMLLAAKLPLPETVFVHGFLNVNGQKISKTVGNVIDPVELVNKYGSAGSPQAGTDAVRFYLLREISPFEDGDFSYGKFEELYNAGLANGLGNFSARVLALGERAGELVFDANDPKTKEILAKAEETRKVVAGKIAEFKFHEAVAAIWGLISFGDAYVNNEKPWEAGKEKIITNAVVILEHVADLLKPFLPETAKKIAECVEVTGHNTLKVKKCPILFPRIEPHV
ncbi:MAG: class I tRNA ligase family protein, partial [bacterium]|nr:class I tRNA ligase family protein [bacterium]